MKKLALLGRDIAHSKSPELYKKHLDLEFSYELMDIDKEEDVPQIEILMKDLDGLNITAPYKRLFLDSVSISADVKKIGGINCIKKHHNEFFGTNTDFLAVREIIADMLSINRDIIILGDGVMSNMTQFILDQIGHTYRVFSRRLTQNFDSLDLNLLEYNGAPLIINTCSRDYFYSGNFHINSTFWNYNYSAALQESSVQSKKVNYVDGLHLLELQAIHAIKFWNF